MPAGDQPRATDAAQAADRLSAIAVGQDLELRARIVAALGEASLTPSATVDSASALAGQELGESTIVLLACDINVPQEITGLRRLRHDAREAAVVVISQPAGGAAVRRALDAGADALVFEPEVELTLAATIRAVASGQAVVPRKLRATVERPTLSHREYQVLALVGKGLTNAQIASRLFLAESTIKSHLASVFAKFGVHSRREAAAVFVDLALSSSSRAPARDGDPSAEHTTA
jgi:DNA-binding NarL/FixJ family response regulator